MKYRRIAGFGVNFKERTPEEKAVTWQIVECIDELFRANDVKPITWWVRDAGHGITAITPIFPSDCHDEAVAVWRFAVDTLERLGAV